MGDRDGEVVHEDICVRQGNVGLISSIWGLFEIARRRRRRSCCCSSLFRALFVCIAVSIAVSCNAMAYVVLGLS